MKRSVAVVAAALSALIAGPALAHSGAAGANVAASFATGFAHPFLGLDHLLAMVAVGFWAASHAPSRRHLAPTAFILAMIGGAALAIGGVAAPFVEFGIAGSVLLLGLLIALAPKLPTAGIVGLVSLFALAHGHAHGAEMPATVAGLVYGAGIVAATALLLGAGSLLGAARLSPRMAGGGLAAAGLLLMVAFAA